MEKRDLPMGNVMVYHIGMAPRFQKLTMFIKVLEVPACNTNKTEAKTLWMLQILGCELSHRGPENGRLSVDPVLR